jgi:hypothetical protein
MHHVVPTSRLPHGGKLAWRRHRPANELGVGRPGGIHRSRPGGSDGLTNADIYFVADHHDLEANAAAIAAVLNQAIPAALFSGKKIVKMPAGTFQLNGEVTGGAVALYVNNIIVRGAGQNRTIFTDGSFRFGDASRMGAATVVSGAMNKGDTSAQLSNLDGVFDEFSPSPAMRIMYITWSDMTDNAAIEAGAMPVFHTEGTTGGFTRGQTVKLTAVDDGTNTVTFWPPIQMDAHAGATAKVIFEKWSHQHNYLGLEDFTVDVEDGAPSYVISLDACYAPHLYNVGVINFNGNYAVKLETCLRPEIRGCNVYGLTGVPPAPGHGGIVTGYCQAMLIEDCRCVDIFPVIEINSNSSGWVIANNYFKGFINLNHGSFNTNGLFIRNVCDGPLVLDSYFGGAARYLIENNVLLGGLHLRRFSYEMVVRRNAMHHSGFNSVDTWETGQGRATLVGQYEGTSKFSAGNFSRNWKQTCTLTTRESDTVGVFTSNGTHRSYLDNVKKLIKPTGGGSAFFVDTIQLIGAMFNPTSGMTSTTTWRATVQTGTLPAEGTVFDIVGPGVTGYPEMCQDTQDGALVVGNEYRGTGTNPLPTRNADWSPSDTFEEYLDDVVPNGNKEANVDLPDYSTHGCPWYGPGNGILNPEDPDEAGLNSVPASVTRLDFERLNLTDNAVAVPSFSPSPGEVAPGTEVTITCDTPGATIHFTTDGSTPSTSSPIFSSAIVINATTMIRTKAVKAGMADSTVRSGLYTIPSGSTGGSARRRVLCARRR